MNTGAGRAGTLVRKDVVTAFIRYQGKVFLLRRSDRVGSYQGRWAAVSGYLERESALDQAWVEIAEETGISAGSLRLIREGEPLQVPAPERETLWVVHPFLFELVSPVPEIHLDWESAEARWVYPEEIPLLEGVPQLAEAWQGLRGG
jgi:8-oxo-dGTP diphosphatase